MSNKIKIGNDPELINTAHMNPGDIGMVNGFSAILMKTDGGTLINLRTGVLLEGNRTVRPLRSITITKE